MRTHGVLSQWQDDQGFGFVQDANGQRAFVHISALRDRSKRPKVGKQCTYQTVVDARGRLVAKHISFHNPPLAAPNNPWQPQAHHRKPYAMPVWAHRMLGVVSLLGLLVTLREAWLPAHTCVALGLMSVITGILYWLDKLFAQTDGWRIQEKTLLGVGLLGGWPGAWLAQTLVRHKSRKMRFQATFWGTVILHLAGLTFLNQPSGQVLLRLLGQAVHTHLLGWSV